MHVDLRNCDMLSHYLPYVKCMIWMFHCELLEYIYLHALNNKKTLNNSKSELNLRWGRGELVMGYIWSKTLCVAENLTLRELDQKYLECFEMWCRRRME
jgi:hypothetical protein